MPFMKWLFDLSAGYADSILHLAEAELDYLTRHWSRAQYIPEQASSPARMAAGYRTADNVAQAKTAMLAMRPAWTRSQEIRRFQLDDHLEQREE